MDATPRHVLMKRQPLTNPLFQAVKRVFTSVYQVKIPLSQADPVIFCPYSLHEDLKDRFQFLQREEKAIYQIMVALPFVQSIEELEANLSDLGKVRFNQLENLREFLRLLNADKHLWARTYRTPFVEKFSILDVSLHQRNEVVESLAT